MRIVESRTFFLLVAAFAAAVLVLVGPLGGSALAQDEEDGDNLGVLECQQLLEQVGGDQYADAAEAGSGDVAAGAGSGDVAAGAGSSDVVAVNNQEFDAEQIQRCEVIVGENNGNPQDDTAPDDQYEEEAGGSSGDSSVMISEEAAAENVINGEASEEGGKLSNTGGPSLALVAGTLALGSAVLASAILRRRS